MVSLMKKSPIPKPTALAQNNTAESRLETGSFHDQHSTSQLRAYHHKVGTLDIQYSVSENRKLVLRGREKPAMTAIRYWYFHVDICTLYKSLLITSCDLTKELWVAAVINEQSLAMLSDSKFFENAKGEMKHKPVRCLILTLRPFSPQLGKYSTNLMILKTGI